MSPPTHHFMPLGDIRLHFLDYGGAGRPTLFLHGVTGHAWTSAALASGLNGISRVLAPDLRGHGDSQWSAVGAYASADLADDIERLVVARADQVDVAGSSWGGIVALLIASRLPKLVRRLAVVDMPPSTDRDPEDVRPRPASFASHQEVVEWERARNPRPSGAMIELLATHGYRPGTDGQLITKYDPYFLRRWPFRTEDHWDLLGKVRQPTAIIRGQDSPILTAEVAADMASRLPECDVTTVPDAGHIVEVDNPAALASTLRGFLQA